MKKDPSSASTVDATGMYIIQIPVQVKDSYTSDLVR